DHVGAGASAEDEATVQKLAPGFRSDSNSNSTRTRPCFLNGRVKPWPSIRPSAYSGPTDTAARQFKVAGSKFKVPGSTFPFGLAPPTTPQHFQLFKRGAVLSFCRNRQQRARC